MGPRSSSRKLGRLKATYKTSEIRSLDVKDGSPGTTLAPNFRYTERIRTVSPSFTCSAIIPLSAYLWQVYARFSYGFSLRWSTLSLSSSVVATRFRFVTFAAAPCGSSR